MLVLIGPLLVSLEGRRVIQLLGAALAPAQTCAVRYTCCFQTAPSARGSLGSWKGMQRVIIRFDCEINTGLLRSTLQCFHMKQKLFFFFFFVFWAWASSWFLTLVTLMYYTLRRSIIHQLFIWSCCWCVFLFFLCCFKIIVFDLILVLLLYMWRHAANHTRCTSTQTTSFCILFIIRNKWSVLVWAVLPFCRLCIIQLNKHRSSSAILIHNSLCFLFQLWASTLFVCWDVLSHAGCFPTYG